MFIISLIILITNDSVIKNTGIPLLIQLVLIYVYIYTFFFFFFVANNLVSKLMSFNGDGLLNSILNVHDIPIDMVKRLIVDFIIAAGDTVRI